jgi:hypothetical protein
MPGSLAAIVISFFLCLPTRAYRFSATSLALKELIVSPLLKRPSLALHDFRYCDIQNITIFGNGTDTVIVEN